MGRKQKLCIREYLSERWKTIVVFALVNVTYFVIYSLYQLPSYAFSYGLELSLFLCIVFFGFDYRRFYLKHTELIKLQESIQVSHLDEIKASGCIEKDYQQLVELLREQLNQCMQEADEKRTNQMEYLTMWTHQIKTPVAALRLLASGMDTSPDKIAIEQEIFRVEEYIGMVLQYLRIDTMNSDLLLKRYNLYDIVKQSVKKYSLLFIRKHLSLEFEPFSCEVVTDAKWLGFVIEQILSNALKYTNEGKIRITCDQHKVLIIEDTGIGIRKEDIKRVFERGYTGYNGRMDKKSTGIGMYLCKRILDRLGHRIEIESEPGVGTKVYVDLKEYQIVTRD